ncbi:DUF192 domain-containing protein [Methanosalsum natronophilum]|uniref:DUF192 domain-containing protein n=1 Tax=Methanosalsum natronophilum TaxID=768733 RepID=A0A3R7WF51_9EURY|nr:DUF192 domain-containing protein [Methanosalsum natronophilum]MCS3923482.1 uncharacterized membrane protein (UPF0127 family) [Methanosalsum natronophilum]RQD88601.1 MAG: DUF192 domain-containing protein [Methanosalsum natronophilum]
MILKANGNCVSSHVEIADTLYKQIKGLMFRKNIDNDYALLFILEKEKFSSVHMLFVNFPIDVLFLDENKKILNISSIRPWIGFSYSSKTKYIIEMKAGEARKKRLEIGETLMFRLKNKNT